MSENVLHRLRVCHKKDLRISYLGHLEMLATLQRSIRRAKLPFAVSNGFAKHMKIQFSQALPVGASSDCEYFDVFLTERVPEDIAYAALLASTPAALAPSACAYVPRSLPALEAWLTRAAWNVVLESEGITAEKLLRASDELVKAGSITYLRGEKERTLSLASTFVSLEPLHEDAGRLELSLDTRSSNLGALRPAVFFSALEKGYPELVGSIDALHVRRVGQWHEDEAGNLLSPL